MWQRMYLTAGCEAADAFDTGDANLSFGNYCAYTLD